MYRLMGPILRPAFQVSYDPCTYHDQETAVMTTYSTSEDSMNLVPFPTGTFNTVYLNIAISQVHLDDPDP